ncbi:MAG TPA: metallophosphoesterase [Thermoanaerobaculia bacterium]|jgi:hypothetical protein|nr:metallophosphoesterase [Thermoanaerobaculia bacterium]
MPHSKKNPPRKPNKPAHQPSAKPGAGAGESMPTSGPHFAEPAVTPDPDKFTVMHTSDKEAYKILDAERGTLQPLPFPIVAGTPEPVVKLADAYGAKGSSIVADIKKAGQIVFHAVGDTGSTHGPSHQNEVADKMVSDYDDPDPRQVPSFYYNLGDVVYSFGERKYYYDQFYDPYRNYPAPIFAIPGNHDGMVAPGVTTPTLQAFLDNFCTAGQAAHRTAEAGELARTAQVQPGVYFTLEAPFVRILGLYSNRLEDPGVISDQGGKYPALDGTQLAFLRAALKRVTDEGFSGALLVAVHHPPYVAQVGAHDVGRHGGSPDMLAEIDAACAEAGVWPHAVLSGHAHSTQRFTRLLDGRQTPFFVAGAGGHAVSHLTKKGDPTIRVPVEQPTLSNGRDTIVFESYDDQDYGYLRIVASETQLRLEYHPATDGASAKTPDDSVTVDLVTRQIVHFQAPPPAASVARGAGRAAHRG